MCETARAQLSAFVRCGTCLRFSRRRMFIGPNSFCATPSRFIANEPESSFHSNLPLMAQGGLKFQRSPRNRSLSLLVPNYELKPFQRVPSRVKAREPRDDYEINSF